MSDELNSIRLNPTMMAALYEKSLVEIMKDGQQIPAIRFLGNNTRNIGIFINNAEHTFLPEDQLSFLTKILGACKLNMGDVAIINTYNYSDTQTIINAIHPSKMILFGVELDANNIVTVSAPSISNLLGETAEAKALKSKLWSDLKQMFGV